MMAWGPVILYIMLACIWGEFGEATLILSLVALLRGGKRVGVGASHRS